MPDFTNWLPESSFSNNWSWEKTLYNSQAVKIFSTDIHGCVDSVTVYIKVQKNYHVYIPNVFCPDAERWNNRGFRPFFDENQVEKVEKIEVWARWGELVFNTYSLESWDGTFRGKDLPSNVFVYIIQIRFKDGVVRTYEGDVLLVR